ncbi:LamG-like jellyroll fold domain-containing protein [Kordia sp.]|uniref:LamG-like jellyroll fold domain-containing protein n=1 Tax=Kordia sp. TaxID=1965332 RepID=UPI003B59EF96
MKNNYSLISLLITFTFSQLSFGQYALQLPNGGNSNVGYPISSAFNPTNAITLEAWVYPTQLQANYWAGSIFSKSESGEKGYDLRIGADGIDFNIGTTSGWRNAYWNTTITPNQWYHIAGVFNGHSVSLYVNGELKATTSFSGSIDPSSVNLLIGENPTWSGRHFYGLIDEIRFWNTARTQTEIDFFKDYRIDNSTDGLVIYSPITTTGSNLDNTASGTSASFWDGNLNLGASIVSGGKNLPLDMPLPDVNINILDDGTVVATENFDSASSAPSGNGGITFNNSIALSAVADVNGTGKGIEFRYDANLFEEEEITLHTFNNVAPGDYIIQYDINAENAGFSYDAVISDGTNSKTQTVGIQTGSGSFQKRYTAQISITTTSDLSFTMQMSPFVSAFTNSLVYIDTVELIKMNTVLPTTVSGTTVEQEENFDATSTTPISGGALSYRNSVALSTDAAVNGTGQGVGFNYTAAYIEVTARVEPVTFTNVPAGSYYIEYQFSDDNTNVNRDFTYYNQITDGMTTTSNFIVVPTTTVFSTHRTYEITTTTTSDISLRLAAGEKQNNVTNGGSIYIDNVRLINLNTLSTDSFESSDSIAVFPNPTKDRFQISGLMQPVRYTLYDISGRLVQTGATSENNSINIQHLSKGMYVLKLDDYKTLKIVKE